MQAASSSAQRRRRRTPPEAAAGHRSRRWTGRRPRPVLTWTHGADDGPSRLPSPGGVSAACSGWWEPGAALAALVAAVLTLVVNGPVDVVPGLSTPDRLTTVGLPAVRAVAEIAMAIAVGALLLAAFLVPPQRSGYLDVAGYRAVRSAAAAALVWAVAAALMVPLTVADSVGSPLSATSWTSGCSPRPFRCSARPRPGWLTAAHRPARARRLPDRPGLGLDGGHLRPLPARTAARRPDGSLRHGRSARRRQRQPGAARRGRLPVGRRAGRGARHRRGARARSGVRARDGRSPLLPHWPWSAGSRSGSPGW